MHTSTLSLSLSIAGDYKHSIHIISENINVFIRSKMEQKTTDRSKRVFQAALFLHLCPSVPALEANELT